MSFGLNRVELIGRLGADVTISHLPNGGRVANLSIATDESYIDRQTGERVDKTEWHRIVTFQDGLISMLEKYAHKGRLVYIDGKLQTRRWTKPGEDGDRFSTEILLVPGGRVQFLDKPNGNGAQAGQADMGDAGTAEARKLLASFIEPARKDSGPKTPGRPMDAFIAEFLDRYARHWKPRTLESKTYLVRKHILPAFGHMTVDAITVEHVRDWFASIAGTPGSANTTMPVLSVMMRMAELWGYRSTASARRMSPPGSTRQARTGPALPTAPSRYCAR